MKKLILVLLISISAWAGLDEKVTIRGRVGNAFDDKQIKVIDVFNQTFFLRRSAFPKGFRPEAGKEFILEIPEKEFDQLKIEQPKK